MLKTKKLSPNNRTANPVVGALKEAAANSDGLVALEVGAPRLCAPQGPPRLAATPALAAPPPDTAEPTQSTPRG